MGNARRTPIVIRGRPRRRLQSLLACSTALTALAVAAGAHAEGPAPLATPMGGAVVAGQASIGQAPGQTTITQGSARAAIDWKSFNVGSQASVTFQQPSAQAVTLNRVLAPDPSTIAGHITANGSIVLVNPNGVVFAHGAEVNAGGLVVSAAGISNRNFMTGHMVFDQPGNPNAGIANHGTITIRQAGLAALVAPEVANSGVIDAKLGHVVLAGARTATLDLYGDGLVSLDVTSAVQTVPVGPDGKRAAALVTNSGTIIAQGGTVALTAAAVDGLVQTLVDAGGTISADGMAGGQAGTVLVQGVGGSIRIAGTLSASGEGGGGTGGAIGLDATGSVVVAKSAAIDASGPAGGGVVAVGTTLARARGGPGVAAGLTAAHVGIAQGATIAADATVDGAGGRVTVLSTATTADHGAISARGGALGGNGGFVEISGHDLALDGAVDTTAPLGVTGSILLDPFDLQIVAEGGNDGDIGQSNTFYGVNGVAWQVNSDESDTVSAVAIEALSGNVTLQAINNLEVSVNLALTKPDQSLLLQAGSSLTIDSGVVVSATGDVEMDAASTAIPGFDPAGGLVMNGDVTAGGNISLSAGTGGIVFGFSGDVGGNLSVNVATGTVALSTPATIEQLSGTITAGTLTGTGGNTLLDNDNTIGTLGAFSSPTGGVIALNDLVDLTVAGPVSALNSFVSLTTVGNLILSGQLNATGGEAVLTSGGSITEPGGAILADTLSGSSGGAALLTGGNVITNLQNFAAGGNFSLINSVPLTLQGIVSVPAGDQIALTTDSLTEGSFLFDEEGEIFGALSAPGGEIAIQPFTPSVPVALVAGGAQPAGTLSLNQALLDGFTAGTLALTSFLTEPITVSGANALGNLTDPNTGMPSGVETLLVAAGGAFTEAPGGSISVGVLTGSGQSAALGGGNDIPILDGFSSTGGFSLTDATGLTVLGNVSDPVGIELSVVLGNLTLGESPTPGTLSSEGTVNLQVPVGAILAPGGSVDAGTLTGQANGLATFGPGSNVSALGSFTVSGPESQLNLTSGVPLAITGVVSAGTFAVSVTGALTEPAGGALDVGALTGSAGSVALGGNNDVSVLQDFASGGNFSLTDAVPPLTLAGPVSVPAGDAIALTTDSLAEGSFFSGLHFGALLAPGGVIAIQPFTPSVPVALVGAGIQPSGTLSLDQNLLNVFTAGRLVLSSFGTEPITVSGANALSNLTNPNTGLASGVGTLGVAAGGAFSEAPGGSISVGVLTGGARSVALGGANDIPILDGFSSTDGFALTDATGLTVLGTLADPTGIALVVAPGNLALGAPGTAGFLSSAGTVNLEVPGGTITDPDGGVTAGTLTGAASGLAMFGFGSEIAALGSFTVSGAGSLLSLNSGVRLAVTGPVSAGTFFIADPGAVTETGSGVLDVGVLTGSAGSVALGGANQIPILDGFSSTGGFALTDVTGLTVLGSVSDSTGITLHVAPGSLTLGNGGAFGLLASEGTVTVQVPNGSITVPNGHLQAGTLTGTANGLAAFGNTHVITLGSFSVSGLAGELALSNNLPLTIAGPISGAFLDISAVGSLTLAGSLTTLGLPLSQQSGANPALPGSVLEVLADAGGTALFQEIGTSVVAPFGGGTDTLRIQLPAAGGTASFANLAAPGTNLVLALGSGQASGTIAVGSLLVIGAGGAANLAGSVAGDTGPLAALVARISPAINTNYLFNRCVIAASFCGSSTAVPPGTPALLAYGGVPPGASLAALPSLLVLALPATVGENWTDSGGFPLPNIATSDY